MSAVAMDMFNKYAPLVASQFVRMNTTETQNSFYPGVEYHNLSWLERQWAAYYIMIGNNLIATGLMSFLLHEIVYFGRAIPWLIIDAIPYFHQWKLQPSKNVTKAQLWKCTKLVLLTHFSVEMPLIVAFEPVVSFFGMKTYQVPFPPAVQMAAQIAFFFVFEDFYHYVAHRCLHWGPLYKNIHKIHHEFSAPIGLAAEYAHPLEVLILGQGTMGGPMLYCMFRQDLHIVTVYLWITLRLFQAVDAHSGYDFPWSLHKFVPFWAGADHHDFHHMAFVNCYSTSFRWLDHFLGTDNKYKAYKARVAKASAAEREAVEKRELAAVEKEGLRAERIAEQGWGKGGMEGVPKGKLE